LTQRSMKMAVCSHNGFSKSTVVNRRDAKCIQTNYNPKSKSRMLVSRPRHRKDEGEVHPCHVEAVRKETCTNPHIRDSGTQMHQLMGESGLMRREVWNESGRPSRSGCVSLRPLLGNVFVNTSNERASTPKKRSRQTLSLSLPSKNNQSCGSITLQREHANP
jgi:hypothetical protein